MINIALLPFLILVLGILTILVTDLIKPNSYRSYAIALASTSVSLMIEILATTLGQTTVWAPIERVLQFDTLAQSFSCLALFLAFLGIGISREAFREEETHSGEYYSLLLTATLGAVLVAHSEELLTFFLAFELLSIPLYILAGFRRYNRKSAEAGLKYFLSGALSSALFLFGSSWVYGACGSTHFHEFLNSYSQGHEQPLILGIMMILGAFAFKISAAPFHMWAPDTYEGAPIPVAAFLSAVPKVVMLAVSIRLFLPLTDQLSDELMLLLAGLAILSIVIGNLVAITQNELTRMAAYSGVAQIGYLLIGLSAMVGLEGSGQHHRTQEAIGSLFFYLLIYTVTNMAFWLILLSVGKSRKSTQLDAFNGLSQTNPFLSFCLLIAAFSLAGVPPLAGFIGKLYLFRMALYSQPMMAFFGVLGSVVSLYYYFNILKRCYFLKPHAKTEPVAVVGSTRALMVLLLALTFVGGLYPKFGQACFVLAEKMLIQ